MVMCVAELVTSNNASRLSFDVFLHAGEDALQFYSSRLQKDSKSGMKFWEMTPGSLCKSHETHLRCVSPGIEKTRVRGSIILLRSIEAKNNCHLHLDAEAQVSSQNETEARTSSAVTWEYILPQFFSQAFQGRHQSSFKIWWIHSAPLHTNHRRTLTMKHTAMGKKTRTVGVNTNWTEHCSCWKCWE